MDHLLSCTCGKEHVVSRSQADQEIKCECGNWLRIPTLRGFSELPVAGASPTSETPSKAVWRGWRGSTMAICSAIFLIAALASGWFLLQRSLLDTSYTAEMDIENGREVFDQQGPNQLTDIWNDYETFGLGNKVRPNYYLWSQYAHERVMLAKIAGSVAAVFGLGAAVIWFTAPRK